MIKEKPTPVIKSILLGAGPPFKGSVHSGLEKASNDVIILDWIISALSAHTSEIDFIGGYEIASVKKKYPTLNFYENTKWPSTKSAGSLLIHDFAGAESYIISYCDIVFRSDLVSALIAMCLIFPSLLTVLGRVDTRADRSGSFKRRKNSWTWEMCNSIRKRHFFIRRDCRVCWFN